jgi:hypothetical protein
MMSGSILVSQPQGGQLPPGGQPPLMPGGKPQGTSFVSGGQTSRSVRSYRAIHTSRSTPASICTPRSTSVSISTSRMATPRMATPRVSTPRVSTSRIPTSRSRSTLVSVFTSRLSTSRSILKSKLSTTSRSIIRSRYWNYTLQLSILSSIRLWISVSSTCYGSIP